MKRTRLLRRSRIRPVRSKPRPGRLRGKALKMLRVDCYARDRGRCQVCGVMTVFDAPAIWGNSYHMDHIVPRHMGGRDELSNVRVLCGDCHRARHDGNKPCPKKEAV